MGGNAVRNSQTDTFCLPINFNLPLKAINSGFWSSLWPCLCSYSQGQHRVIYGSGGGESRSKHTVSCFEADLTGVASLIDTDLQCPLVISALLLLLMGLPMSDEEVTSV